VSARIAAVAGFGGVVSTPPAGAEGGIGACGKVDESPIFEVDEGEFDGDSCELFGEVEGVAY